MGLEKDYMERELKRLVLMLTGLIEKATGLKANNAIAEIPELNETLEKEFGLTLESLSQMTESELQQKAETIHGSALEKLSELVYTLITNPELPDQSEYYNKALLRSKAIFLIDYLNDHTDTFSLQRMNMKMVLQNSY